MKFFQFLKTNSKKNIIFKNKIKRSRLIHQLGDPAMEPDVHAAGDIASVDVRDGIGAGPALLICA